MTAAQVLALYSGLRGAGVRVWIDGGWCVDALLGEQVRAHADLDIAVARADEAALRTFLQHAGFEEDPGGSESVFVLSAADGRRVDVHLFAYGSAHDNVWGVAYPWGSLSGTGCIDGREVDCIAPEWMFRFKTAYSPAAKDREDVMRLARRFGFVVPPTHEIPR
jgi:lincosamide nucleotidyltransferase A/C/D/E